MKQKWKGCIPYWHNWSICTKSIFLHSSGAHFKDHLYVPEVHPITGVEFCEQEDEGHIFKVCLCENI